jgi:hypothetical protein
MKDGGWLNFRLGSLFLPFSSARSGTKRSACVTLAKAGTHRGIALDTQTRERSSSAEGPRLPATKPAQLSPPEDCPTKNGTQEKDKPPPSLLARLRQHWLLASVATCVLLAVLLGGAIYWFSVRDYESTDDAFIAARSFAIAPKVAGYVREVPVTDNQHVKTGDLLARIDDRDYVVAVNQAKVQVAIAEANIDNVQAQINSQHQQIDQAKAELDQAEAQLKFAEQEEARAKDLVQKGAGSPARAADPFRPAVAASQYIPGESCVERRRAWRQDARGAARKCASGAAAGAGPARSGQSQSAIHTRDSRTSRSRRQAIGRRWDPGRGGPGADDVRSG